MFKTELLIICIMLMLYLQDGIKSSTGCNKEALECNNEGLHQNKSGCRVCPLLLATTGGALCEDSGWVKEVVLTEITRQQSLGKETWGSTTR